MNDLKRFSLWVAFTGGLVASGIAIRWYRKRKTPEVFDRVKRTDVSQKKRSESIFSYWNRTALPRSRKSRALIEDWLSHVPEAEQVQLRLRFRCGDDIAFGTAFQELVLHELLLRQRCKPRLHPAIVGTTKLPDFGVLQPRGPEFLLEACSSTDV